MQYLETCKIFVTSNVAQKLTGHAVSREELIPIWAILPDEGGVFMRTLWERSGGIDILPNSIDFAHHLSSLLSMLFAKPQNCEWTIGLDQHEKLTFLPRDQVRFAKQNSVFQLDLGRGITFSIWNPVKLLQLRDIERFLGDAMCHFKRLAKEGDRAMLCSLPYVEIVPGRKHLIARLEITNTLNGNAAPSPLDDWIRSSISAYAAATTAQDIGNDPNVVLEYLGEDRADHCAAVLQMGRQERLLFTFTEILKRHLLTSPLKVVA